MMKSIACFGRFPWDSGVEAWQIRQRAGQIRDWQRFSQNIPLRFDVFRFLRSAPIVFQSTLL
jgi:hypothetical protein